MDKYLGLLVALTLAVPAAAEPAADFESSLRAIAPALIARAQAIQKDERTGTQETGPNDPLLLEQKPLIDLIKKVEPSVVFLLITVPGKPLPSPAGLPPLPAIASRLICTGFFTNARDMGRPSVIVTNSHCVEQVAVGTEIEVGLYQGTDDRPKMTKGKVLAFGDSASAKDVAFVELLDPKLNRPALPLWSKLDRGETVVAIGHPRGLNYSVSKGIVSALGRDSMGVMPMLDMTQSDAAVNHGNSGGPLFNMWGSVVGINTLIITRTGDFAGISLSLPAAYITLAMQQYKRTGNLKLGSIKAELSLLDESKPLSVSAVTAGGPAAAANLQAGDVLLTIDRTPLGPDARDAAKTLATYLKYRSPGESVTLAVRRAGKVLRLPMTLVEKAPFEPIPVPPALPEPKKTADEPAGLFL